MPTFIETHDARVFKAVVEENGFKRAADRLFVTQSAVSQTIANLEAKLDTRLLERNPLALTEAGIRLLDYANNLLREEESVRTDIRNINQGILATLSLALSSTVNRLYGKALVERCLEQNPLTRIRMLVLPSRQLNPAISAGQWELGFGPFQRTMPNWLTTWPLFEDERVLVVDAKRAAAGLDTDALLASVPLLVSQLDDPALRPTLDKLRDVFGTIWEVSDLATRIDLIVAGHGMGYLDRRVLDRDPRCQHLVPVEGPEFSSMRLTFGLFHRKARTLSAGGQAFVDLATAMDWSTPPGR